MIESTHSYLVFLYKHPFIRYLIIGGSTFVLDLSLLVLLHGHFEVNLTIAASIGYWVSVTYNFLLNRWWVFSAQESRSLHKHALLYASLLTVNYLYTVVGMNILTRYMTYELAKVFVIVFAITWTYPIYKHYIFTKKGEVTGIV